METMNIATYFNEGGPSPRCRAEFYCSSGSRIDRNCLRGKSCLFFQRGEARVRPRNHFVSKVLYQQAQNQLVLAVTGGSYGRLTYAYPTDPDENILVA